MLLPVRRVVLLGLVIAAAGCDDAPPGSGGLDAAGVDAPGPHDGGSAHDAAPVTDLEFCVTATNTYRAMVSKPALAHSAQLEAFANTGAMVDTLAMSAHKHFSDTNGGGISFAENECPSFLGWNVQGTVHDTIAACIAAFWSEGPGGGHYENMISDNQALGCGVYLDGTGGITITQDYGP